MNRVQRIAKINAAVNGIVKQATDEGAPPELVALISTVLRPFAVAMDDAQAEGKDAEVFKQSVMTVFGYMTVELTARMVPKNDLPSAQYYASALLRGAVDVALEQIEGNFHAERKDQASGGAETPADGRLFRPH